MYFGIGKGIAIGIAAGLLVLLQVSVLEAQGYAPVTPFQVTGTRGYFGFEAEQDDAFRENPSANVTLDKQEIILSQELNVGLDAYVYHPKFLALSVDVGKIYDQKRFYSDQELANKENADTTEYSLFMRVLKEHPLSFWLGKGRQRQEIGSPFFQKVYLLNDREQAGFAYRSSLFNLRSGFNSYTIKGGDLRIRDESLGQIQSQERDEQEKIFFVDLRNSGKLGENLLKYENRKRIEKRGVTTSTNDFNSKSQKIDFTNRYLLGQDEKKSLSSSYSVLERKGRLPLRYTRVEEYLSIRNSKALQTYYNYFYSDNRYEARDIEHYRYRAGLNHQSYQSLQTSCEIMSDKLRFDSDTEDQVSGRVQLNYNKKVPFGRLGLNTLFHMINEDEKFSGALKQVFNENHTFGENLESDRVILIDQNLVEPSSILFVDSDGLPLRDGAGVPLEEGLHYSVETIGTLTKVRLLSPDGDFLIGQTVLVNYSFEPFPEIEFNTFTRRYGATYDIFGVWKIFFSTGKVSQRRVSGTDLNRLEDTRDKGYGAEIIWKNSTTRAEKREYRSRRNPYETRILSERLVFPLTPSAVLGLNGTYSDTVNFSVLDKTIDRTLSANLRIRLPRNVRWKIIAEYVNQDQRVEYLESIKFGSELKWRYKRLNLLLTHEHLELKRKISGDEDRNRIFLMVRRYFGSQNRRAW